jgi:hypothetical protein
MCDKEWNCLILGSDLGGSDSCVHTGNKNSPQSFIQSENHISSNIRLFLATVSTFLRMQEISIRTELQVSPNRCETLTFYFTWKTNLTSAISSVTIPNWFRLSESAFAHFCSALGTSSIRSFDISWRWNQYWIEEAILAVMASSGYWKVVQN